MTSAIGIARRPGLMIPVTFFESHFMTISTGVRFDPGAPALDREGYVRRVRRFIVFLSEGGLARLKAKRAAPVLDRRVAEFQEWLRRHRGITERTIDRHGRMVMRLLPALGPRPQSWDAHLVREVIVAETKQTSPGHWPLPVRWPLTRTSRSRTPPGHVAPAHPAHPDPRARTPRRRRASR